METDQGGAALFLIYPDPDAPRVGTPSLGTAFAIEGTALLATAAHVVEHRDAWVLMNRLVSQDLYRADVVAADAASDLALMHTDAPLRTALSLSSASTVMPGSGVVTWDWPDTTTSLGRDVTPRAYAGLTVDSLPSTNGKLRIVGHARRGMSGGPVVEIATNTVIGVLTAARQDIDPQEIVETWWGSVNDSWEGTAREVDLLLEGLRAQLALSYAIAAPISPLRHLVESAT